jgi:hypothetical protein
MVIRLDDYNDGVLWLKISIGRGRIMPSYSRNSTFTVKNIIGIKNHTGKSNLQPIPIKSTAKLVK